MQTQSKAWFVAAALGLVLMARAGAEPVAADVEMTLGIPGAPITMIEYASMTCPHCAAFAVQVFDQVKANYIDTGKVRFVFREFPLDQTAVLGAVLARCSGAGRFFPFVDVLFRQQAQWALAADPIAALGQIGQLGGLSQAEFQACLADQALVNGIVNSRLSGEQQYQVDSTPTFLINNVKYVGEQTYESLAEVFETALRGEPLVAATGAATSASSGTAASTYIAIGVGLILVAGIAFFFLRRPKSGNA